MTRRAVSLFTAAMLAFMIGCPEVVDTDGSGDDLCNPACATGQTCENGVCVTGQTPDDVCNPACGADQTCVEGACVTVDPPAGSGNAADGEAFYTANNCTLCHSADGSGAGVGNPNAPSIVASSAASILNTLTVAGQHPGGISPAETTQQNADDIVAFLASL